MSEREEGGQALPLIPVTSNDGENALAKGREANPMAEGTLTVVLERAQVDDAGRIPAMGPAAVAGAGTGGDESTSVVEEGDADKQRSKAGADPGVAREDMAVETPASGQPPLQEQASATVAMDAALEAQMGTADNPTTTARGVPEVEETASASGGHSLGVSCNEPRRQQESQQRQTQKCPASAPAVTPASGANTNDAILSTRPKVRAVVFPRPHTHKPRERPAGRRARGSEVGLPGPGQYDVAGAGGGGGGGGGGLGEGAKGPLVAPKRLA